MPRTKKNTKKYQGGNVMIYMNVTTKARADRIVKATKESRSAAIDTALFGYEQELISKGKINI